MVDVLNTRASQEWVEKAEDFADLIIRRTRKQLPHIARLLLVATFIEDGFRLTLQMGDQIDYISSLWNFPTFISAIFILINICTQFAGSGMVLLRRYGRIGVFILMATVGLQTLGYGIFSGIFLVRNISLCGSLVLLLAESEESQRSIMAGLPSTGVRQSQQYILLLGRIMVVLMFLTLFILSLNSIPQIIWAFLCLAGILLVAVGYKTKLIALVLVILLIGQNFYFNCFWTASVGSVMWDYLKYDFFQTLSIIGGLMLIVSYGPGGVSVDDYKKKW